MPTDASSAEEKNKYNRWTHSKKICLVTMKHNIEKTIKDNIPEATNAKKILVDVGNKFKKFDKTEKSNYRQGVSSSLAVWPSSALGRFLTQSFGH